MRVCGSAVVQLDYDKEEEPWYAIYGSMLAELEGQRTIRRVKLCFLFYNGFVMFFRTINHPHTDKMGIIDGFLWRGEEGCLGLRQQDADCAIKRCELPQECAEKDWDLDVKHVQAHRTKQEEGYDEGPAIFVMEGRDKQMRWPKKERIGWWADGIHQLGVGV